MSLRYLAAVFCYCTALGVQAAPRVTVDLQHYLIKAKDAATIRSQIEKLGPVGKNGRRYHAYTQWKIEWGFRWIESNGRCKIQHTDVEVRIDMLLPRLEPAQRSEDLQQGWDRYYAALLRHEQHHRNFGIAAATEIDTELNSIREWLVCNQMEQVVNERADAILLRYTEAERRFDERTDHGAKDGVVLP